MKIKPEKIVRLVINKDELLKMAAKPTFVCRKIFIENLVARHKVKESITLNRPVYIGLYFKNIGV